MLLGRVPAHKDTPAQEEVPMIRGTEITGAPAGMWQRITPSNSALMSDRHPHHPSLPRPPHLPPNPTLWTQAPPITQAVHYAAPIQAQNYQFQSPYSSHYAQAYAQYQQQQIPVTSNLGYTYSSMYTGVPDIIPNFATSSNATPTFSLPRPQQNYGSWYQPGNCRCTQKNCSFTGSKKSLETHMMDRHLIYPHGWKKERSNDWDADPSLKGKPLPIQGTNLVLDTPEAIDSWVEDRKKRWPSADKVQEKKRKLEEAVERGQLTPMQAGLSGSRKRQRMDGDGRGPQDGRGRGRGQGRGRGRGRGSDFGRGRGRGRGGSGSANLAAYHDAPATAPSTQMAAISGTVEATKPKHVVQLVEACGGNDSSSEEEDKDDAPPEVVSSKAPPPSETALPEPTLAPASSATLAPLTKRQPPRQPKPPPHNPFAPRRDLLKQLLLPEIRITVSNLSQAIRFLVDNDFLDNVELKPEERLIDVVGSRGGEPIPEDGKQANDL